MPSEQCHTLSSILRSKHGLTFKVFSLEALQKRRPSKPSYADRSVSSAKQTSGSSETGVECYTPHATWRTRQPTAWTPHVQMGWMSSSLTERTQWLQVVSPYCSKA